MINRYHRPPTPRMPARSNAGGRAADKGKASYWGRMPSGAQLVSNTRTGTACTASMAMPRFRVAVNEKLLRAVTRSSDGLWPGQGRRGVSRLTRDAIRRYARYSNGYTRRRAK